MNLTDTNIKFDYFKIVNKTIIIILVLNMNLFSQLRGTKYDDKLLFQGLNGMTLGLNSQNWTIKDFGKVSQISAPISFSIPISNRILLSLTNTPVITNRKSDATEIREAIDEKIQNISDTRLSLSYVLPGDKTWINSNFNIPTGLTKLNPSQFEIARVVSQSSLGFRLPVFGQGINGTIGFTNAYTVNRRLTLGYGASFGYKGKFNPYVVKIDTVNNESQYDPGDDLSFNFGADYTTQNKKNRFSGDLTISESKVDKINQINSFKSGTRFNLFFVYQFKEDNVIQFAQMRARIKVKNTIYSDTIQTKEKSAQQVELNYIYRWNAASWLYLSSNAEYKIHNGDQIPFGDVIFEIGRARVGSIGSEIGITPFSNASMNFGVKYNFGNTSIEEKYLKANGYEISFNSRILF